MPLLSFALGFAPNPPEESEAAIWAAAIDAALSDTAIIDTCSTLVTDLDSGASDAALAFDCAAIAEAVLGLLISNGYLKELITLELIDHGASGVFLGLDVIKAEAILDSVGLVYTGLAGLQFYEFYSEVKTLHRINMCAVNASGFGSVTVS